MLGLVGELVIEVDEGTFDVRKELELLLQSLSDVVGLLQRHICRQDDVDLDKVVGPESVASDSVDVPDRLVVVPAEVSELLQVLGRSRSPNQGIHILQDSKGPGPDCV